MYTEISKNKRNSWFLITGFVILIVLLCWVFSLALNNQVIMYVGVGFALFYAAISYFYSSNMVLAASGAKPVAKKDNPTLYRTVENLAITAGIPTPNIYIIDDTAPNAFATGRDPQHAMVCVTSGLLDKLDKQELQGVIAHELSHIGNYDVKLMTLVVMLVSIVILLSDWFLRISIFGDDDSGDSGNLQLIILGIAIVFAILAPIIGMLFQLAVSRKREYLADASGALLTRYPEGLASALEKIETDTEPLEAANRATENLYIINPLREGVKNDQRGWFASMFSTHPPTAERIKRLRAMDIKP
jgi:heat shock protein HtpX